MREKGVEGCEGERGGVRVPMGMENGGRGKGRKGKRGFGCVMYKWQARLLGWEMEYAVEKEDTGNGGVEETSLQRYEEKRKRKYK